ncbi:helix-turn-helix domain-containing protein [Flavobacterium humi]|uniref:AraC family transcriptional regulator n=1 Tax=Flavobacterium humi TaxID=2562683 RepID=A0A4Z0L6W4_9FLAO|nr:helix-turn-helix domain-containing protein [Flavobacterium humi]TGD57509.1 AraC family transcriptional regulator [Flavobacterium humi]
MKQYILPHDIMEKGQTGQDVYAFDYLVNTPSTKNQIALTQNVFSFLLEGSKELVHFDKKAKIEKQQFLLIKAGRCLMTENVSEDRNYRSLLFFFDNEILLNFIEKNKIQLKTSSQNSPFFVFDYDHYIRHFVESLIQVTRMPSAFKNQFLQTKTDELLLYLVHKNGTGFLSEFLHTPADASAHFTSVIENNLYNNLSVAELAFLCHASVSSFKRKFEKTYGQSPIKWFQEKRLEHASFLMEHKKLRPSDVYGEMGYESLSSFIQAYKKKFGTTPKQHFI